MAWTVMEDELRNRLEVVWKKLDVGECQTRGLSGRNENVTKVLKQWKYRTRKSSKGCRKPWNRFLPRKLQRLTPLYDNMVEIAYRESGGARLRDLHGLLERCERIQEGCKEGFTDWDDQWLNPLSLASKGWDFTSIDGNGKLVCACHSCRRTLYLDLNNEQCSAEYLRKSVWLNGVSNAHEARCQWKDVQFDLEKEYYLQKSNLIYDIERINKALQQSQTIAETKTSEGFLTADQSVQLKQVFHCHEDNQDLELLLRGFQHIGGECEIVQCSACFCKVFLKNLRGSKLNYHESWCRYHQEHKLTEMILTSLSMELVQGSVTQRLHNLETYLADL